MTFDAFPRRLTRPAYTYRATVVSIYDGDTMTVDLDLGLGIWQRGQKLRLYGIDTPELRGPERPEGLRVRDAVFTACPVGSEIIVQTMKDKTGKYGRWLAIVWTPHLPISLNEWLVDEGMAEIYLP